MNNRPVNDAGLSDRQLTWFYVMLGLGCFAHELLWIDTYVLSDGATLGSYLRPYQLLTPTVPWSEPVVFAAHIVFILFAGLMILDRRGQSLWATLQFPVVCTHYLIQGTKPSNHLFFLGVALAIHAVYVLIDVAAHRLGRHTREFVSQNRRFLRLNCLMLLASTYIVAGLMKLNYDFVQPSTTIAAGFAWKPISPFNHILVEMLGRNHPLAEAMWTLYGVIGIAATFFFEFGIPICLLVPRMRRLGMAMGVFFHLMILYGSAMDFSVIAMSLYPLVLTAPEFATLANRCYKQPTRFALLSSALLSLYLCFVVYKFQLPAKLLDPLALYRMSHVIIVIYVMFQLFRFAWDGLADSKRHPKNRPEVIKHVPGGRHEYV